MCAVAAPRSDGRLCVHDACSGETVECAVAADGDASRASTGLAAYVSAVAHRVARNFPDPRPGANIAFASDLPHAAGMSSSSTLVTALFLSLSATNGLEARAAYRRAIRDRQDLAGYLGCIENGDSFGELTGERGVGTFGGSEDHTAILCGVPGALVQYAFCPVRHERTVALPPECVIAIATSGVTAEKTGAARDSYNQVSLLAREITARWSAATGVHYPTLAAAVEASPRAADDILRMLVSERNDAGTTAGVDAMIARFEQFLLESYEMVPAAADALARRDMAVLGAVVDRSQDAAERWLGNQIPETSFLARSARELGARAASAFGAGFGGSVWALVQQNDAPEFCARWMAGFAEQFPGAAPRAGALVTHAGPGAMSLA